MIIIRMVLHRMLNQIASFYIQHYIALFYSRFIALYLKSEHTDCFCILL